MELNKKYLTPDDKIIKIIEILPEHDRYDCVYQHLDYEGFRGYATKEYLTKYCTPIPTRLIWQENMQEIYTIGVGIGLILTIIAYFVQMAQAKEISDPFVHTTWGEQYLDTQKKEIFHKSMFRLVLSLIWPAALIWIGWLGAKEL